MKATVSAVLACILLGVIQTPAETPSNAELLAAIQRDDRNAILEAGKSGDKTFIPILSERAKPRGVPPLDPEKLTGISPRDVEMLKRDRERPRFDPIADAAKMALAKLGVKEYRDEIVSELTTTNSTNFRTTYRELTELAGVSRDKAVQDAKYSTQLDALQKLAYINDSSTIKYIAPLLYDTTDPSPKPAPGAMDRVVLSSLAQLAVHTLKQMVRPLPSNVQGVTDMDEIRAWQQWWEQNKDKYP
jgi:hypothetical protein